MTLSSWLRSITFSCAVTLALVPYASAQDKAALVAETAMLQSTDHNALMRAASAACMLYPTDRKSILTLLEGTKWMIGGDDEWIEADFNDVWVTLMGSNDDFFCDVQGDISQATALAVLKDMITATHWDNWTITPQDGECHSLSHPQGLGIYITSSGNDPVCTPQPHSAIRISAQGN